jgi:hypothetical protein
MRLLLMIVIAMGCGGAQRSPSPAPPAPAPPAVAAPPAPAAPVRSACDRLMELQAEQCGNFGRTIKMTREECTQQLPADSTDPTTRALVACLTTPPDCNGVVQCLSGLGKPDPQHLRACEDKQGMESVGVSADEYAQRDGSRFAHYAQAASTKAAPIERCGVDDANAWLGGLTCADGSHPINTGADAEQARIGNVGEGGRCGSIIDHYRVACPEGATDIFIDAYVCPRP